MAILDLRNVSVGFGEGSAREEVLRNIDLEVSKGEFVAILGFSGTGKSTLMNLLAGLILADRLREAGDVMTQAEAALAQAQSAPAVQVEVPVLPAGLEDSIAELTARAEALAALAEEKAAQ